MLKCNEHSFDRTPMGKLKSLAALRFCLAVLAASAVGTPFQAHAVCLDGRAPTVAREAGAADAVLIGRVVGEQVLSEDPADPKGITATVYAVAVQEALRGSVDGSILLRSENTSSRFPMQVGKSYLLFVSAASGGTRAVDSCGNSGLLAEKADAVRLLKR